MQDNVDADRISRVGIEEFIRLCPEVFRRVWGIDLVHFSVAGWPTQHLRKVCPLGGRRPDGLSPSSRGLHAQAQGR